VFGTKSAGALFPLSPYEERVGREPERGEIHKNYLLSPALSSFYEEEREKKYASLRQANSLPNTNGL
jgi:hypothetical protein